MQLKKTTLECYTGKTKRSLPNVEFPRGFHVIYTENLWSNQLKATEYFEEVVFAYFDQITENMAYPKKQMSLVIMDTSKGQNSDDLREHCAKNN